MTGKQRGGNTTMLKVGIIGVTGYTGTELVRILHTHPDAEITYASSMDNVGRRIGEAIPHLYIGGDQVITDFKVKEATSEADLFFVCLPHGASMEIVGLLKDAGSQVVDLSADFRLSDMDVYEKWYGAHTRKDLNEAAVYGMPELHRESIRGADLVANPGCYPTSVILALAPLVSRGLLDTKNIVIDSKSGISGAGRTPLPGTHFPEAYNNFSAYNIAGRHRHICEMEQELGVLAGTEITVNFTPHLLPVSRGILSTIYCQPADRILDDEELYSIYKEHYRDERFVRISAPDSPLPSLKDIKGTNEVFIGPRTDSRNGKITIISCLDNLVKGASGQAVQNMNLMVGIPEVTGLDHRPVHP
jgi:N-acetyl-gamma-glutamyl-phosphate reductase